MGVINLKEFCETLVLDRILEALIRKKKLLSKQWIVSMDQWINLMQLDLLRNWLNTFCVFPVFDAFMSKSIRKLSEAKYHDILACCFHLFSGKHTQTSVLPECLKMDQAHRTYILALLTENCQNLRKLDFQCYNGFQTFYVSDEEKSILQKLLINLQKLVVIKLKNVANDELVQTLVDHCKILQILVLSGSKEITNASAEILSGVSRLVIKGKQTNSLYKYYLAKQKNHCFSGPLRRLEKCKRTEKSGLLTSLRLLDISRTAINVSGIAVLTSNFKPCLQIKFA